MLKDGFKLKGKGDRKMAITEFSKNYHEKMFSGYHSTFLETDPEFIERFDNFAFDEVVNQDNLDGKTSKALHSKNPHHLKILLFESRRFC